MADLHLISKQEETKSRWNPRPCDEATEDVDVSGRTSPQVLPHPHPHPRAGGVVVVLALAPLLEI